ncbi:MAG: ABC transporter ATP-binding protein [Candidatus Xenobiia bacterium LiM19]
MAFGISVQNLAKRFKTVTALENITFEIAPGELFGVLGPDGAGKTTLCRILAGLMKPSSGKVMLGGIDVGKHPEKIKDHTGYMPRDYGLYGDLAVEENINFYADIFKVPSRERKERMDRILGFTGMSPFKKRRSQFLSGGMKQKLQLACALIHTPQYLILDEPTYGVDPVSRREFWKLLLELLKDGLTILISTSYMDEAQRCHRIALLHNGKVLKLDRTDSIISCLPGTMVEISCENSIEVARKVEQFPEVRKATLYGDRIHVLLNEGVQEEALYSRLTGECAGVSRKERITPSLEDAFIFLVEEEKNNE